ncbi:hypothetical protein [Okeania sp. KiyG1]|uniref:hypothetical protein n=1 Tax=Okeania sp. KiyG1 TaxID=2720165 RepID=UPI0019211B0E|nr:hypothetical protein [Okeania sp. KiyG1]
MLTVGLWVVDAETDRSTDNSVTNTIEKGRRQKTEGASQQDVHTPPDQKRRSQAFHFKGMKKRSFCWRITTLTAVADTFAFAQHPVVARQAENDVLNF